MEKEIAVVSPTVPAELEITDVVRQAGKIQKLMSELMKPDEHYGVIPGTSGKPTLLKAGAEKLCFTFRLIPAFEVIKIELPNNHREYEVKCTLTNQITGDFMGQGVGLCSTMESKYRYRKGEPKPTGQPIPDDYNEKKAEYRAKGYGCTKIDGQWVWVEYSGKVENPDIADIYNTVLKMAKKRAHVDATITACAASDIFTQDIEDMDLGAKPAASNNAGTTPDPVYSAIAKSNFSDDEKNSLYHQYQTKPNETAKKKFGEHIIDMVNARKSENNERVVSAETEQELNDIFDKNISDPTYVDRQNKGEK